MTSDAAVSTPLTRPVGAAASTGLVPRWPSFIDGACDGILVAFAGWTVFYQLAMATQASMLWAGWPWIVLTTTLSIVGGLRSVRQRVTAVRRSRTSSDGQEPARDWKLLCVALLVLLALVMARQSIGIWPIALASFVILALQILPMVTNRSTEYERVLVPSAASHWFAMALSLGLGVLGSFMLRPDADDVYYVNRATWVATHGTAALGDTMFSSNALPPALGGGIPTPSIEAAQGVLAHTLNIDAATVCYVVAVPVLGFLIGWTTWRVIREFARCRWGLAMAGSTLFLLASAHTIFGNYSLGRIWQGKAIALVILLPLVWLLLSRTVVQTKRSDIFMLLAAGVAFVGLTTTSALQAPVIVGASLCAAVLLRCRFLAVGALAFAAGPLLNGIGQLIAPIDVGGGGGNRMASAGSTFNITYGAALPMTMLALAAVVLTPRLVPGRVGVLLGSGSAASMVVLLPGAIELTDAVSGAGAIAWRLAPILPTWVLVGLLVTVPGRLGRGRVRQLVNAAVVVMVFAIPPTFGTWLWDGRGVRSSSQPSWKVDQAALADVQAARKLDVSDGLWLMPQAQMQILAISGIEPHAVVPRAYYLPTLQVPAADLQARRSLLALQMGRPVQPSVVRASMEQLDVSLACVSSQDRQAAAILSQAVDDELFTVSGMSCHVSSKDR